MEFYNRYYFKMVKIDMEGYKLVKKIRLIRTMIKEFKPNPNHYPENVNTIEEIAEFEVNIEDKELQFEECDSDTVVWEIIESEEE